MKQLALLVLFSLLICGTFAIAQEQPATKPTAEELEKQKEEWTKNAFRLLDQVIDEAQSLRLNDNRVRIHINAADLLWDRDQGRARSMFMVAGDAVAEMMRTPETTQRSGQNQTRQTLAVASGTCLNCCPTRCSAGVSTSGDYQATCFHTDH